VCEGNSFTSLQKGRYVVCLSVSLPVCPPQIARSLAWDRTLVSEVTRRWHYTDFWRSEL